MVVPPVAAAVGVAAAAAAMRAMLQAEKKASFAQIDEDDVCVLLGEEAAADGKQWFECSSPKPGMECSKTDDFVVPVQSQTCVRHHRIVDSYLCKAPKVAGEDGLP